MEDNEKKVVDDTVEETQEDVNEVEETKEELEDNSEDNSDDEDSTEDSDSELEQLRKENKTLTIQKDKWRKKAELTKNSAANKTNTNYLTRDEGILLAKGYDEDDITQLQKIAGDGNLVEATKDPLFIAFKGDKERKEKSKKAQLGTSSSGANKGQKPVSEMTEKEHKAMFYKSVGQ